MVLHLRPHEHHADWKKGIQPTELIDYLYSKRHVSENRVSWTDFAAPDYFYCIADMIDTTLGYNLTSNLVRKIINDPSIPFSANSIINEFKKLMYQILSYQATSNYTLYTRVDGTKKLGFSEFKYNEMRVRCKIPKNFVVERSEFTALALRSGIAYECSSDTGIIVQAKGHHIGDFAEAAIECVNYICGIFNLAVDPKNYVVFGERNISTVWMGSAPIFFLFDDKERSDTFYRESRFKDLVRNKPQYEEIASQSFIKFHKAVSRADKKLSYLNLRSTIARLYVAKAEPDVHIRFVKLWSLLEILTLSGADRGKVCRRIAHFFTGSQLGVIANIARYFRNSAVHEGREHANVYIYAHYLSEMCSQFIRFYIASGHKFFSEDHVAEYLDTPRSGEALAKLQKEVRSMKFRVRDLEFSHKRLSVQVAGRQS